MLPMMGPRIIHCTLLDVRPLAQDVALYTLGLAEPLPLRAGQFIMLHVPQADGSVPKRAYSVLDAPPAGSGSVGEVHLCIKHLPGGAATELLTHGRVGDALTISGPFGHFGLQPALAGIRRLFVATGTGITPFIGMLEELKQRGESDVTVLAGYRHREDVLFREELIAALGDERVRVTLTQPDASWEGLRGRVTEHLASCVAAPSATHAYVCGNPTMVEEVRVQLEQLGVPREQVFFEKFTSHGKSKQSPSHAPPT